MGHGHAGDGDTGDNGATVVDAGDAYQPEHSRAEDAIAGGVGKRAAVDEAAGAVSVVEVRIGRGVEAAAEKQKQWQWD